MTNESINVSNNLAIDVRELRKSYGATEAVRGIDLRVHKGEIFALLGPNGAGKTTTVEILEGHRSRSSGHVLILGHDPARRDARLRQQIGIVLQQTGVEPHLTVEESINLFSGYYHHPHNTEQLLSVTGLLEIRNNRVRKLSGGQQRRLDVAIGLVGNPELLFLDEPTTGFDPMARRAVWDLIKTLKSLGRTIFLTTHYMEEAEFLADRVAIIAKGKIISEGSPTDLSGPETNTIIKFHLDSFPDNLPISISEIERDNDGLFVIQTAKPEETLFQLTSWSLNNNIKLIDIHVSKPSLEETYLNLLQSHIDYKGSK